MVFILNRSVFPLLSDRARSYESPDRILAIPAPVQLVAQVVTWMVLYDLGFGLLLWPRSAEVTSAARWSKPAESAKPERHVRPDGSPTASPFTVNESPNEDTRPGQDEALPPAS